MDTTHSIQTQDRGVESARMATNVVSVVLLLQFIGTAVYLVFEDYPGLDGLFMYQGIFWGFVFVAYAYWLLSNPERRTAVLGVLAGLYVLTAVAGVAGIFAYWLIVDGEIYATEFISLLSVAVSTAAVVFAAIQLQRMPRSPLRTSAGVPGPGWQPDPTARHDERFFDGTRWTAQVKDGSTATEDPL